MTEATTEETEMAETETVQISMLFELENIAVAGRRVLFDVLKSTLGDKGVKLTPVMFSRYCIHASPDVYLPSVFEAAGKKTGPDAKLLNEVNQGQKLSLLDGSVKLNKRFKTVLDHAASEKVTIGALTSLDQDTATQLMSKLGFDKLGVELLCIPASDRDFPTADAWLKLAKQMSTNPQLCMVYSSSTTACKAGLSAGMRCVAIPDEYTNFQDFGGADFIIESDDTDLHFHDLLELVSK
jgi:beta-phosphoglucomutase-like phosphatase (HAD superfamily)